MQVHSTEEEEGNAITQWNRRSSKGTDADLVNSTRTAQGDIYYNNGSAIARLAAGTSGQALLTGGTGAHPSWGDAGGGVLQTVFTQTDTMFRSSSSSYVATPLVATITPTSSSSKIVIFLRALHGVNGDSYPRFKWYRRISGGASGFLTTEHNNANGGNSLGTYLYDSPDTNNLDQLNILSDI